MKNKDFTIQDIFHVLLSNIIWILIGTVAFGIAAWAYTTYRVPKTYRTTVTLFAESYPNRNSEEGITSSELSSNKQLAVNYAYIFRSNSVMKMAAEELKKNGINYSYGALKGMTQVTTTNSSIFSAVFTSTDQKNLQVIAETISAMGVKRIQEIVKTGAVTILDHAEYASVPISPDVSNNTLIGAVMGFVLTSILFIVKALTNTTVWNEDDLTKQYEIPVLGTIPLLSAAEKTSAITYTAEKE